MSKARTGWTITLDYHGTHDEATRFFDWLVDAIPEEFEPTGEGTGGVDGMSMGPSDE